ncbi:aminotransferase [Phaeosphaeriaceae sp. PMI808]|nr:aminotransferase [Phaeosphaeriaceae sp. PMI808]
MSLSSATPHHEIPLPHLITHVLEDSYVLADSSKILDASCGAGVSCFGLDGDHYQEIRTAFNNVRTTYVPCRSFSTPEAKKFITDLVDSTNGAMVNAWVYKNGTDAVESSFKLSRQFWVNEGQSQRVWIISREGSYHGNGGLALSASGFKQRRELYEDILPSNVSRISSCNPYRDRKTGQSDEMYVNGKAIELESKILELGANKVMAFIVEPVVGAALGCVPAVPGYLRAMKAVCDKYGVLLIFDEIMCGTGRSGTLHTWQEHGVIPDIQTMGKGLGGGVESVSATLCNSRVYNVISRDTGFINGLTFECQPGACKVGSLVLEIVRDHLGNIDDKGKQLMGLLRQNLGDHPNVGDIRGKGLFIGIEFVRDKATKEPFDPVLKVSERFFHKAVKDHKIHVWYGGGCVDGDRGDHIIIAPQYNCTSDYIHRLIDQITPAVHDFFPLEEV